MKTPELKKLKEENDVFLFFLFVKKTNSIIQHQVAYTIEKGYNVVRISTDELKEYNTKNKDRKHRFTGPVFPNKVTMDILAHDRI